MDELKEKLYELGNKKSTVIIVGLVIIFVFGSFLILPRIQKKIRSAEMASLVTNQVKSKKVNFLEYQTADTTIREQSALSVMFARPNGATYEKVVKLLNSKKMAEFNRVLYMYPIVYQAQGVKETYKVDPEKVTLVFFEKGQEKKRYEIEQTTDLQTMFIPELNRLPMASVGVAPESSATTTSSGADGAKTSSGNK